MHFYGKMAAVTELLQEMCKAQVVMSTCELPGQVCVVFNLDSNSIFLSVNVTNSLNYFLFANTHPES